MRPLQSSFSGDRVDEEGELIAGARTFPIIALLGVASALAATELNDAWPFARTVIAVGLLLAVIDPPLLKSVWGGRVDRQCGESGVLRISLDIFMGCSRRTIKTSPRP